MDLGLPGVKGTSRRAEGHRFGASLAAGNFNGDKFSDLAVGSPSHNFSAGAINILYGIQARANSGRRPVLDSRQSRNQGSGRARHVRQRGPVLRRGAGHRGYRPGRFRRSRCRNPRVRRFRRRSVRLTPRIIRREGPAVESRQPRHQRGVRQRQRHGYRALRPRRRVRFDTRSSGTSGARRSSTWPSGLPGTLSPAV